MGRSVETYKPWHLPITFSSSIPSPFLMKFMQNSCFFSYFLSSPSRSILTCTSNQKGLQVLYSCRVVAKENLRKFYLCRSLGEESGPQGTVNNWRLLLENYVKVWEWSRGHHFLCYSRSHVLLQLKSVLSSVQPSIKGMSFFCCVLSPSPFLLSFFSFLHLFISSFLFSSFSLCHTNWWLLTSSLVQPTYSVFNFLMEFTVVSQPIYTHTLLLLPSSSRFSY